MSAHPYMSGNKNASLLPLLLLLLLVYACTGSCCEEVVEKLADRAYQSLQVMRQGAPGYRFIAGIAGECLGL